MTVFDYIVLVIVGFSVVFGVMRGLVREVLSLAAWVAAFVAANFLAPQAARLLPVAMASEEIRLIVGFTSVFLAVLVGLSVLSVMASKLVKIAGLGTVDRTLGGAFGMARGLLVVMVVVLLAGLTSAPSQAAWRNALLSKQLERLAGHIIPWLPPEFARRIKY